MPETLAEERRRERGSEGLCTQDARHKERMRQRPPSQPCLTLPQSFQEDKGRESHAPTHCRRSPGEELKANGTPTIIQERGTCSRFPPHSYIRSECSGLPTSSSGQPVVTWSVLLP